MQGKNILSKTVAMTLVGRKQGCFRNSAGRDARATNLPSTVEARVTSVHRLCPRHEPSVHCRGMSHLGTSIAD
jgi:hypothetical protein